MRLHRLFASPERLLWAVRVRWLVIGGFLCLAIAAHALGMFATLTPCVYAALVGSSVNGVNEWCVRRRRWIIPVTVIAIPLDHVLITYIVIQTGGVHSPFVTMYFVQVLATAMLVATWVAAASALFGMTLWLAALSVQASGYIAAPPLFVTGSAATASGYQIIWAAFLLYCLALLIYLGGYIVERLRASERALAEQNQRLEQALSSSRVAQGATRAAYERLKQTEAHLIQSEKMRGLGQLVAGVAHELNNPISFVAANVQHLRGYADRLRLALDAYRAAIRSTDDAARLDVRLRDLRINQVLADLPGLLDDCEEGARRTNDIVKALQRFSRSDAGETWQRTDLHHGIESTLGLLSHRLRERIVVHRNFGELPNIECLPGQLNQVFMNLLVNAADAIGPNGGNIWIETRTCAATSSGLREPSVVVAVRDDGAGMNGKVQARIFEPFFTTKPVGHGTGLGLSVSYGIVERHRGTLTVHSTVGSGSTFTLTLPIRQSPASQNRGGSVRCAHIEDIPQPFRQ